MPLPFGTSTHCQRLAQHTMWNYRGPSEELGKHICEKVMTPLLNLSTHILRTPDFEQSAQPFLFKRASEATLWVYYSYSEDIIVQRCHLKHLLDVKSLFPPMASYGLPCSTCSSSFFRGWHATYRSSWQCRGLCTCFGPGLNGFHLARNCTFICSSPCAPARNHPRRAGEVPTFKTDTYARCMILTRLKLRHVGDAWAAFPPGGKPLSHTDPTRNSEGMTFHLMFFRSGLERLASLHDALSHYEPLQSQTAVSCHLLGELSTLHLEPCLLVKLINGTTNHHMLLHFAPVPKLVRCPRCSRPKVTLKIEPDLIIMRRLETRNLLIDELQKVFFSIARPTVSDGSLLSLPYLSPPSVLILRFCSIILLFRMQGDVKTDVKEPALSDRAALNCLQTDAVEHNSIHTF